MSDDEGMDESSEFESDDDCSGDESGSESESEDDTADEEVERESNYAENSSLYFFFYWGVGNFLAFIVIKVTKNCKIMKILSLGGRRPYMEGGGSMLKKLLL